MKKLGKLLRYLFTGPQIFLALIIVGFYELVTYLDKLANTSALFPNTNGKLVVAIYLLVMGMLTAGIARSKSREHIGWFVCGTFLQPLPLLLILLMPTKK
jgi:hypothetical protein